MGETRPATVSKLIDEAPVVDLAVILLVPGILALVYLLPNAIKQGYVLRYTAPTAITAFSAHYVHFTEAHLLSNVLGYLLVVTISYAFAILSDRRRWFVSFFVVSVLGLPFAVSALNVALVRPRIGYGFSPIVMGYLGFLPIAMTGFLESRFTNLVDLDHAPVFFFAGLGIVAVQSVPGPTRFLVLLPILAIVAFYFVEILRDLVRSGISRDVWIGGSEGETVLLTVGIVIFAGMPFVAFPADPVNAGKITNLYSHMLGYSLGFIAPYVTFRLLD